MRVIYINSKFKLMAKVGLKRRLAFFSDKLTKVIKLLFI